MKRKYLDEYINFGFTYVLAPGVQKPQCVLCNEVLSVESMMLNKLKHHLETKHPQFKNKDSEFFKHKAEQLKKACFDSDGAIQQQSKATLTVSLQVAKANKKKRVHTIGKELILPCAKEIVSQII